MRRTGAEVAVENVHEPLDGFEVLQLCLTVFADALELPKGTLDLLEITEEELFKSLQRDDVDALLGQELCALRLR